MSNTEYFVHESSYVDEGCVIGNGTKVWHFSHIMSHCTLGENCNIGQNVVISPDVVLGKNVKVQNNVSIYTGVTCDDDVFLGLFLHSHRLASADHTFAIEGEARLLAGLHASGDENFRGLMFGFFAVLVRHLDHSGLRNRGFASDIVDFVFLK